MRRLQIFQYDSQIFGGISYGKSASADLPEHKVLMNKSIICVALVFASFASNTMRHSIIKGTGTKVKLYCICQETPVYGKLRHVNERQTELRKKARWLK